MCIFTGPVARVSGTSIFARDVDAAHQALAYSMSASTPEDVAMVLPQPVPPGTPEGAVRFLDLSAEPRFFERLATAFEDVLPRGGTFGASRQAEASALAVEQVGSFEASFVPRVADFARLDARFRLRDEVWAALPGYGDFGFAVFKLRAAPAPRPAPLPWWRTLGRNAPPDSPGVPSAALQRPAHPMAFVFPRRDEDLFFPTLHVHDDRVRPTAEFDHTLYAQAGGAVPRELTGWGERSVRPLRGLFSGRAAELVDLDAPVHRLRLTGALPNRDTVLAPAGVSA